MDLKIGRDELVRRFSAAFEYFRLVQAHSGIDARTWLDLLDTARAKHLLELKMALLHPDVVPIAADRWSMRRGGRIFIPRSGRGSSCWASQVWGYDCPNRSSNLELDHAWPFALGGQSVPENGVWLCSVHNRAKSSDVHLYSWHQDDTPSWVSVFLEHLRLDLVSRRYEVGRR